MPSPISWNTVDELLTNKIYQEQHLRNLGRYLEATITPRSRPWLHTASKVPASHHELTVAQQLLHDMVIPFVHDYLQIRQQELPAKSPPLISMSSTSYHPELKFITVASHTSDEQQVLLAHEYTHHVQTCLGMPRGCPAFTEGHATGVERAYVQRVLGADWIEQDMYLLSHYLKTCQEKGIEAGPLSRHTFAISLPTTPVLKGLTAFTLLQLERGEEIYARCLRGLDALR